MNTRSTRPSFPHQIAPRTFPKRLQTLLSEQLAQLDSLLKQAPAAFSWESLMQVLEDQKDTLERSWAPFSHLHAVRTTPLIRKAYEQCLPLLTHYHTAVQQNTTLYQAIKTIPQATLSPTQKKIIQDTLLDFELAGVHLPEADKKRFHDLEKTLSELSAKFEHNVMDAEMAYEQHLNDQTTLSGLPKHFIEQAKQRAVDKKLPGFVLTLDPPSYLTIMTHADHRPLRQTIYEAYITRASNKGPHAGKFDNTPLIDQILTLRAEQAQLLGFATYAELSLQKKMATSVQDIETLLDEVLKHAHQQGQEEFHALSRFAQTHCQLTTLQPWDMAYASEKRKQFELSLHQEKLRVYFTESAVWNGIQFILKQLYGLQLEPFQLKNAWHPTVRGFVLHDQTNQSRGYLYVDLFARPHKRGGAWMDVLQTRRRLKNGQIQLPIATLTCNFSAPTPAHPATLLHEEIITLLHELGHCLHHLLSQIDEYSASGLHEFEWDAVELPSQLFEHWGWNDTALTHLSAHMKTKRPLPKKQAHLLQRSQTFQSAMAVLRQLEFAYFDLAIHHHLPEQGTEWIEGILHAIRKRVGVVPVHPDNRFAQSFSHIFAGGYAAGYYSYLWAEILSSDVFSRFETEGVFNAKTGHDFMRFMEAGSSKQAQELFETFMGRPASIHSFLRHRGIHSSAAST